MKKTLQPTHQVPQKSASESSARLGGQAAEGRSSGNLGRIAATINQSPHVQTQLKLAKQLQSGVQNQKNLELAGAMNQTVAQAKDKEKTPRKEDEKKKPKTPAAQAPGQLKEKPTAARNRTGLPDQLKAGVESLSGISMDDVKVHYNSAQPAQLNALAYAQGTDIHVAAGQEKHLAHEAWHIAQQKQGRVQPTAQMKPGVPINDDPRLEREADIMGAQAAQKKGAAQMNGKKGKGKSKKVKEENQSWRNLLAYRPGWVRDNDITEERVKEFCRSEKRKIRGHASGDSSQGEQGNTTEDLNAFRSWHRDNYGWR